MGERAIIAFKAIFLLYYLETHFSDFGSSSEACCSGLSASTSPTHRNPNGMSSPSINDYHHNPHDYATLQPLRSICEGEEFNLLKNSNETSAFCDEPNHISGFRNDDRIYKNNNNTSKTTMHRNSGGFSSASSSSATTSSEVSNINKFYSLSLVF